MNARADVRTAWLAYRGAYDLAQHTRDAVVPLARRVSAEQLKLYNGMLIGVLDLDADATERINAVNAALESERDFWFAWAVFKPETEVIITDRETGRREDGQD